MFPKATSHRANGYSLKSVELKYIKDRSEAVNIMGWLQQQRCGREKDRFLIVTLANLLYRESHHHSRILMLQQMTVRHVGMLFRGIMIELHQYLAARAVDVYRILPA